MTYGFDASEARVWLHALNTDASGGVLCARHADAMLVPRGWVLDDRRDAVPRLFHLPAPDDTGETVLRRRTRRRGPSTADDSGSVQLRLEDVGSTVATISDRVTPPPPDREPGDPDATVALPWTPVFDDTDDLDGVLDARGELLARAFRGTGRRRA